MMSEEVLLYLDNVDEYVNDENKIVTYKWLSKTLKIHVNLAKRLLFMFTQQERNKKDNDDLSVTYFVAGLHTDNNGIMKHSCFVVPETDLNGVRSSLSPVTSCHIYSVHKVKLKDTNALYTTDFEKIKENIFDASSYSAIKYSKAKPQSKEELSKQSQVSDKQDPISVADKAKQNMPVSSNAPSVNKKKTDGKNSIASMFSQQSKPIKKEVPEKTEPQKTEEIKKTVNNKEPQKKEGVKSFFKSNGKHSPTPQTTVKTIEEKVDINKNQKSPEKTSSAKRKGKQSDSDDRKKTSKRRRIKSDVFDSSSEDEMAALSAEEEEDPLPVRPDSEPQEMIPPTPSPPKNKTPANKQSESGGRKRKRIKKLVTKTYKDEDGFMLTEKVYETDSTDASESDKEDPIPSNIKAKMTETEQSKQTNQKKKSPPKKASPVKGKQTSLTSFFKKK